MYVRPISTRFVRGRSTPAIRAISQTLSVRSHFALRPAHLALRSHVYPCRCLCFWFEQITRTTPRRRTILHLSQIRLTDARTFIVVPVHVERETRKARKEEFYFAASAVFAFHVFVTPSRRCARAWRPPARAPAAPGRRPGSARSCGPSGR